ncbi:MAG: hypothetical protein QF733_04650 [Phycisphaerales bacterium]|nr:hypothetical protein [Phycisphaerales bacterium]
MTRTMFRPDYLTRDLQILVDILTLDDDQAAVVEMLLEDYDANFRLAVEETEAAMADLGAASGADELERDRVDELRGQMEAMRDEMRQAREAREAAADRADGEADGEEDSPESDEARAAARAEREALRAEYRERMGAIREAFRAVREAQLNTEVMQDLLASQMQLLKQFARARESMGDETANSIAGILNEQQLESWAELERRLRRMRMLPEGRLQGSRTDLTLIVEPFAANLEPEAVATLADIMLAWELDLDRGLQRRADFDAQGMFDLLVAMQDSDADRMLEILGKRQKREEGVRDVTDTTIDLISATIPAPDGTAFRKNALQAGYDRIYETTRSQRAIGAAVKLPDLDPELVVQIEQLGADCDIDIDDANEAILVVVRRHEQPLEVRFVERMQQRASGADSSQRDDDTNPIREAYDARDAVDEIYIERLGDLLGEERVAELPGGRERGRRGGEGRWGGDDREARRAAFMEAFDTNKDGEIDDAEREKIREHFQGRGGRGGPPPFGPGG